MNNGESSLTPQESFIQDESGNITGIVLDQGGMKQKAPKKELAKK